MRVVKQPLDEMTDFGAGSLGALNHRRVDVSPGVYRFGMGDVALLLQNADGGEHRVVGQQLLTLKIVEHLLNGRGATLPENLHEPKFGFSERS